MRRYRRKRRKNFSLRQELLFDLAKGIAYSFGMKISFLSPHRDDIAFSCAYLLLGALRAGLPVGMVTVFTISDYAPYLPAIPPGDRIGAISAHRLAEDRHFLAEAEAAAAAGRPVAPHDLTRRDAPVRLDIRVDDVFCGIETDAGEYLALAEDFAAMANDADLIFAPAAIGGHLDHRLTRKAAELAFPPERLALYEDLPYAANLGENDERLPDAVHGMRGYDFFLRDAPPEIRRRFAACYPSQVGPGGGDADAGLCRWEWRRRTALPAAWTGGGVAGCPGRGRVAAARLTL